MRLYFFLLIVIFNFKSFAQSDTTITRLKRELSKEKDLNKIIELTQKLCAYTEAYEPNSTADIINNTILLAEQSRDRNMMIQARRAAATIYLGNSNEQAKAELAKKYATDALEICKLENVSNKEIVSSNMLMARIQRSFGKATDALIYNQEAINIANKTNDDSLKIISYIGNGNTLLYLDEKVKAFKSFLTAQELADKSLHQSIKEIKLSVKNNFVNFYLKVEDYDRAIDYQYQILNYYKETNKTNEQLYMLSLIADNYLAAKKYDVAKATYLSIEKLSDSLKLPDYKNRAIVGKLNVYILTKDKDKVMEILKNNSQIIEGFTKTDMVYILDQGFGDMYHELGMNDSATYYYKKAIPVIDKRASIYSRCDAHYSYGYHLFKINNYSSAIAELQIADKLCDSSNNLAKKATVLNILDSCYQKTGDFKNAYLYSTKYREVQKLLDEKGKEKEVLSLEIEATKKQNEYLAKLEEEKTTKRHYFQYSGILILIISLFTILAAFGVFKVPIKWIRIIGFFSFILLFEFIILLADTWIHHATHGEPWKVLGIKVVLIALLMPFHHYLEHKVISFVTRKHAIK